VRTVLLLRHADVDEPPNGAPEDWPLNEAGRARAETLARVAGAAGITAIYTSEALRTKQTAAPLAAKLGLEPNEVPPTPELTQQLLSAGAGGAVLIVGHSDTVPEMIQGLGASFPGPPIQGHDDLFVVTVIEASKASAVRLKYGAPSSP
jgi:phosphohistidine phosphatase SixA